MPRGRLSRLVCTLFIPSDYERKDFAGMHMGRALVRDTTTCWRPLYCGHYFPVGAFCVRCLHGLLSRLYT
jgi:hypothetical protein